MTNKPASSPDTAPQRSQSSPPSQPVEPVQRSQSVPTPQKSQPVPKSQPAQKSRRKRLQADRSGVLIAAGIMAGISWVLLYFLINGMKPLAFGRWMFFILVYIAITGTVLPLLWYLNQRFSRVTPVTGGILLRQGMWCGLFAVMVAWLQMVRALTFANGFFLGLSMITVEFFLRIRERAQYMADRGTPHE